VIGSFISDYANYGAVDAGGIPVTSLEFLPAPAGTAPPYVPHVPINHVRPLLLDNAYVVYDPSDLYNPTMPLLSSSVLPGAPPRPAVVCFPDLQLGAYVDVLTLTTAVNPGLRVPQVALADRVIPPLPPIPSAVAGPPPPAITAQWLAQLNARRFAWDVLYRLDFPRSRPDPVPNVAGGLSQPVQPPVSGIYQPLSGPGMADTGPATPDDFAVTTAGTTVKPGQLIVAPGLDGILQSVPNNANPGGDDEIKGGPFGIRLAEPRTFTLYCITLKRTDSAQRFAVQGLATTGANLIVNPASPTPSSAPTPPTPANPGDVLFPVPWRVKIKVYPNTQPSTAGTFKVWNPPTGKPSMAEVPDPGATGLMPAQRDALIAMFPVGQVFIDEVSGQVYRVTRRTLANVGTATEHALLTLDKEIQLTVDAIDDHGDGDYSYQGTGGVVIPGRPAWGNWALDPGEDVRTVWVYPPQIEREAGGAYTFSGASPVAGIEIRKLQIAP
jgi:hypothetical protein